MRTFVLSSLVLSAAAACWAADPVQSAAPAAPVPAAATVVAPPALPAPVQLTPEQQQQAFMANGYFLALRARFGSAAKDLQMSPAEIEATIQGIALAVKGEQLPFSVESIAEGAEALVGQRAAVAAQARDVAAKEWAVTNAAFLAKVDADTTVTKTASGLRYKIVAPGAAEKPVATSTVKARYTGKLCDGKVFDSTEDKGGEPLEFSLGGVIRGWTEGLQLIGKGGKIHLWVPADLGYGAQGGGPLPGGSVLEFDVELVDFK